MIARMPSGPPSSVSARAGVSFPEATYELTSLTMGLQLVARRLLVWFRVQAVDRVEQLHPERVRLTVVQRSIRFQAVNRRDHVRDRLRRGEDQAHRIFLWLGIIAVAMTNR